MLNQQSDFEHRQPRVSNATIVGIAVFCILGAVVLPTLFHELTHRRIGNGWTPCEANLKQIGNSLKMYLADWDETYPTNRPYIKDHKLGQISSNVKLSALGNGKDGKPRKFQHGINWVEGLYNYMEPVAAQDDDTSVWKCNSACKNLEPTDSKSAAVTYAFNRNLIEQPEKVIRSGSTLMMICESDRLLDAELRPRNKSNGNPNEHPKMAFFNGIKLHSEGSHILFADGHVKIYSAKQFFSNGCEWDAKTGAWFNAGDKKAGTVQAIQITPQIGL